RHRTLGLGFQLPFVSCTHMVESCIFRLMTKFPEPVSPSSYPGSGPRRILVDAGRYFNNDYYRGAGALILPRGHRTIGVIWISGLIFCLSTTSNCYTGFLSVCLHATE